MSQSQTLACPLCGDSPFEKLFEKKRRNFWRCQSCGLEKQHPLPTPNELSEYYESSFRDGLYKTFTAAGDMKRMTAEQRIKELLPHVPLEGRWLDVGCANGEFIAQLQARGMQTVEGLELSSVAVEQAVARGLNVRCGTMEDLPAGETYDCISAFDVIEHVLDPLGFLQQITARLKPRGRLVLTMPDKSSLHRRLMGRRWYFYIPEEHLHYYDGTVMRGLFAKVGLTTVHTGTSFKPLTFDYGLTQFEEYNPIIHRMLKAFSVVLPSSLRQRIVPWPIGEFMAVAVKV